MPKTEQIPDFEWPRCPECGADNIDVSRDPGWGWSASCGDCCCYCGDSAETPQDALRAAVRDFAANKEHTHADE